MTDRRCPNCGTEASPRARFCRACGAPLGDDIAEAGVEAPAIGDTTPTASERRQKAVQEDRRIFEQGMHEALASLLESRERLLAHGMCVLAGTVLKGRTSYNQSVVGRARNTEAARRAKHDAGPNTLAGSYPDQPVFQYRLVVTTDRLLACRMGMRIRWGRRLRGTPVIKQLLWQVDRHRVTSATARELDRRPVIRLEFDDGTMLDLAPENETKASELLTAVTRAVGPGVQE